MHLQESIREIMHSQSILANALYRESIRDIMHYVQKKANEFLKKRLTIFFSKNFLS